MSYPGRPQLYQILFSLLFSSLLSTNSITQPQSTMTAKDDTSISATCISSATTKKMPPEIGTSSKRAADDDLESPTRRVRALVSSNHVDLLLGNSYDIDGRHRRGASRMGKGRSIAQIEVIVD